MGILFFACNKFDIAPQLNTGSWIVGQNHNKHSKGIRYAERKSKMV